MISDLHDFIEKKTDYDIEKLTLLKHSFYQFKLKIIEEKLPEIKESDLISHLKVRKNEFQ